jgi:hypothetical protein
LKNDVLFIDLIIIEVLERMRVAGTVAQLANSASVDICVAPR